MIPFKFTATLQTRFNVTISIAPNDENFFHFQLEGNWILIGIIFFQCQKLLKREEKKKNARGGTNNK